MKILESAENYLETILVLGRKNGSVRSIDVANELGFSKASVSVAMKNFREEGYIYIGEDGCINLTEKGLGIAERIYARHEVLAKALMAIGVDEETAYDDACRIEHYISDKSILKIKEYLDEVE